MHVFLISACEKKAWRHSRSILESYALRAGERAWATPITREGLEELRGLLKRSATRQTAVACYRNDGNQRMKLLWVVGSRHAFGPDGHFPSGFTRRQPKPLPNWFRDASLLAQIGGYAHDIGKSGKPFAEKLAQALSKEGEAVELVRHEWVSLRLFQQAMASGWDSAWDALASGSRIMAAGMLVKGVICEQTAAQFLIASHHKLFGKRNEIQPVNAEGHLKTNSLVGGISSAGEIDPDILKRIDHLMKRLSRKANDGGGRGPNYWRPVALIARAALILADHRISSLNYADDIAANREPTSDLLFANTKKDQQTGRMRYDQPLDWHLKSVGELAGNLVYKMLTTTFEPLCEMTVEAILTPSENRKFRWQDEAVRFIQQIREVDSAPALVFNMAGTGAGKTRANAKIACVLSESPRFNVALNLRSLTLQTGDSMKHDLGLGADELGVVIGDRVVEKLHQSSRDAFSTEGEDTEFSVFAESPALPGWLEELDDKGKAGKLLAPPVLVSTIDFIINAGEPGRQGHHALALLRLMSSDLVLDEIDSYDPESLVAVLRLIQIAGMLGRNVICSSATLCTPVASVVYTAFLAGLKMNAALEQREKPPFVLLVDDLLPPVRVVIEDGEQESERVFRNAMSSRQGEIMAVLRFKPAYRVPDLVLIAERSEKAWLCAVEAAARRFHGAHQWGSEDGKRLSFGLVRTANIKTAIRVARHLADNWPEARVACYHANELLIQRHLKEKRLDFLLNRKKTDNTRILSDLEIQAALEQNPSVPFIVVATPVEEIGRDHDFDWAVIEPSSAHSIVQASGRVNRHRLSAVEIPNIGLLDFNMRYASTTDEQKDRPCFIKPGLEFLANRRRGRYSSSTLAKLLQWEQLDRIDAAVRFGDHPMARDEDQLIEIRLREPLEIIRSQQGHESSWMARGFYDKFPLRAFVEKRRFRLVPDASVQELEMVFEMLDPDSVKRHPYQAKWIRRGLANTIERANNDWLAWPEEEILLELEGLGISADSGMIVEIPTYGEVDEFAVCWDKSFGFQVFK